MYSIQESDTSGIRNAREERGGCWEGEIWGNTGRTWGVDHLEIWRKSSRKETASAKEGLEVGKATRLMQLVWLLPVRPLGALGLTKSPLGTRKMDQADRGPSPTQHPSWGVVLSLEDKVGKYRPNTAFYACDTNILPRTETLKLPLPHSSPLSPNPVRSFFHSLSILLLLLIPPPTF